MTFIPVFNQGMAQQMTAMPTFNAMPLQQARQATALVPVTLAFPQNAPDPSAYYMARFQANNAMQMRAAVMPQFRPAVMPGLVPGMQDLQKLLFSMLGNFQLSPYGFPPAGQLQGFGVPGAGPRFTPPMNQMLFGGAGRFGGAMMGLQYINEKKIDAEVGGFLAPYGGAKKLDNGNYEITKGKWAGHKAIWLEDRKAFHLVDNKTNMPKGLFQHASKTEKLASDINTKQIGGGWIAGHGGYHKAGGGTVITAGRYKGHTAYWMPEQKQFHIKNTSTGESVGCWKPPTKTEKVASPLTFDLNGNGKVDTTNGGKQFDINADGKVDNTAWAGKGDGVLAFDADGDGRVGTDGKELFGNYADIDGDGRSDGLANGFDALRALAVKHLGEAAVADGKLDAQELALLEQLTGLTMLVDGERRSLSDLGITDINLGYEEAGTNADENGNEHRQVGVGFTRNGEENQKVNDVWFKYE
ncbi:hypothetical protein [Veronia pacifica]|uniref:EF-hand domain-containing protein n=1 Tax=Veronia pacifica TaxID=1080227 RepID=A0A1C3EDE2_9GAMM|nr:hypothetical protein [Veronia pacifica]ODA31220.1 hypothetical protein A8L45_17825 [Veronia pacifica]